MVLSLSFLLYLKRQVQCLCPSEFLTYHQELFMFTSFFFMGTGLGFLCPVSLFMPFNWHTQSILLDIVVDMFGFISTLLPFVLHFSYQFLFFY